MRRNAVIAMAVLAAVAVTIVVLVLSQARRRRQRRENFSLGGLLGTIGRTIRTGVLTAGAATIGFVTGKKILARVPATYVGRTWDGADWSCPQGTVETGLSDNSKACISSQFHQARSDGTCPIGTVPTGEKAKCEVGYTGRFYDGTKWVCPEGTDDTGLSWDKGWREGQKQCRRRRAYTMRITKDGRLQCPPNTTDTGRTTSDQCKWNGNVG